MSKWQRLQTEWKEFKLGKFTHSKDKDFSREWICLHVNLILFKHSRELHFILTEIQASGYAQWLIQSWTEIVSSLPCFFHFLCRVGSHGFDRTQALFCHSLGAMHELILLLHDKVLNLSSGNYTSYDLLNRYKNKGPYAVDARLAWSYWKASFT